MYIKKQPTMKVKVSGPELKRRKLVRQILEMIEDYKEPVLEQIKETLTRKLKALDKKFSPPQEFTFLSARETRSRRYPTSRRSVRSPRSSSSGGSDSEGSPRSPQHYEEEFDF